jgi:SprB-like repeat protein
MKKFLSYLIISLALLTSCEEDISPVIENLPLVASYSITHVSENGASDGAITITATDGTDPYQFKLDDGEFQTESSFTGLLADTFYVMVMDGVGVVLIFDNIIIEEPSIDNITVSLDVTNVTVFNGSDGTITATAKGGTPPYLFKLDEGDFSDNNFFDNLSIGIHVLTVKDAVDSVEVLNVPITQPDYIPITFTLDKTDVTIYGDADGEITITNVNGGYGEITYSIDGITYENTTTFSDLIADDYTIYLKDDVTILDTVVIITQPEELTGSAIETDLGEITVTADGGVKPYTVNGIEFDGSIEFTELIADNYTFDISDANGATISTITVTLVSLSIGDEYLGGIVFKLVDGTTYPNQHGIVVGKNRLDGANWIDANNECINYQAENNDNWRLPDLEEMEIILLEKFENNNLDKCIIYEAQSHWTSIPGDEGTHWTMTYYLPTNPPSTNVGIKSWEVNDVWLRYYIPVSTF